MSAPSSRTSTRKTQVRLLQSIAAQVAGAVENSRQYRKMEKRASQLSTLSEVSKTITSDLYLEEILQLIVAATAKTMSFKICTLMLLDEDKQELVIKATQSKSRDYVKKPNIKIGESIAGPRPGRRPHHHRLRSEALRGIRHARTSPARKAWRRWPPSRCWSRTKRSAS